MSLVGFSLKRPYTVASLVILVCLLGVFAAMRMPVDIFPEINITVISVVWTCNGMSALEIQDRILVKHERQMASLVDDIAHMEANSYTGVGVIKVYLHDGADVSRAVSQLTSSAQTVLKSMPRNITPPLILRYGATDVPIIQLSLASDRLPDHRMTDFGQQVLRPNLAVVHGASVPYPYGGKPRVMMVDLDPQELQSRGMTPMDVVTALQSQNIVSPSGDVKIGDVDYAVAMNNSPDVIQAMNDYPVKQLRGATALLVMKGMDQTLNTMTLGGFALAVGILVDNSTIVIENIERNLGLGKHLIPAIEEGSAEIFTPTLISTFAICIVFVPIFLLEGT